MSSAEGPPVRARAEAGAEAESIRRSAVCQQGREAAECDQKLLLGYIYIYIDVIYGHWDGRQNDRRPRERF